MRDEMQCARLIRKESADVVIVIESLERKKTCLSSLQAARLLRVDVKMSRICS